MYLTHAIICTYMHDVCMYARYVCTNYGVCVYMLCVHICLVCTHFNKLLLKLILRDVAISIKQMERVRMSRRQIGRGLDWWGSYHSAVNETEIATSSNHFAVYFDEMFTKGKESLGLIATSSINKQGGYTNLMHDLANFSKRKDHEGICQTLCEWMEVCICVYMYTHACVP